MEKDSHFIVAEDIDLPVEVTRVDDEEGAFISLAVDFEGDADSEHAFFVSFSIENAVKLAELLQRLAKKRK